MKILCNTELSIIPGHAELKNIVDSMRSMGFHISIIQYFKENNRWPVPYEWNITIKMESTGRCVDYKILGSGVKSLDGFCDVLLAVCDGCCRELRKDAAGKS